MGVKVRLTVGSNRRGSVLDLGNVLTHSKYLSPFQVEKHIYMFNALFDLEKNGLVEKGDMLELAEKMRNYMGRTKEDPMYQHIIDVMMVFLECLMDQVQSEEAASAEAEVIEDWKVALTTKKPDVSSISLAQWLNMWGRLSYGSAGLSGFPCWVQMLPKIFFEVIDLDQDGVISKDEYRKFLKDFVGVSVGDLDSIVETGFKALTASGAYEMTQENFNFCFANFLLGRNIYGPGKYLFGVFDNRDMSEKFQVQYNAEDEE